MSAYQVRNWAEHFETYESKRLRKMTWVRVTNRRDGTGFRRIARHPRAHEIMGAWLMIVELASEMPVRGLLVNRRGQALGPVEMADETGFPEEGFRLAIGVLTDPGIGWLEAKTGGGYPHRVRAKNEGKTPADSDGLPADRDGLPADRSQIPADSDPFDGESANSLVETDRGEEEDTRRSQALGLDWRKYRPANLPRGLHTTWEQIAKSHGGPIANTALEAARRIYGATFNHGQLSAVYQLAHRNDMLSFAASNWPNPNAKPERPEPGDGFQSAPQSAIDQILADAIANGADWRDPE